MFKPYDNLNPKSAQLSRKTLYKIWHTRGNISAVPQVLSQTFLRVESTNFIMKSALLCLLTVGNISSYHCHQYIVIFLSSSGVASCELFFSPGNEYVYTYSGKILTGIPEVDTTFAGMSITGQIIVQATRANTFKLAVSYAYFTNIF